MTLKRIYVFIILFSICLIGFSQEKDSIAIYSKIERFSDKSEFTKIIYDLIFSSMDDQNPQKNYSKYHNKTIGSISIKTLDPFGYSVFDHSLKPEYGIERAGNFVHIKSRKFAIKNLLLFKEKESLDTLLIHESKRLMRTQNHISSVEIEIEDSSTDPNTIDITIYVLDSWSLLPAFSSEKNTTSISLEEYNFIGFGHQFDNTYSTHSQNNKSSYSFRYIIPTIKNSYINSTIASRNTPNGFYKHYLNIERNFISPLTKWAGGAYFTNQHNQYDLLDNLKNETSQNFKFNTTDVWLGRSFHILKEKSIYGRTTNLITSLRKIQVNYTLKPSNLFDPTNYFSNENFYIGQIGIDSRQFVQDQYIYRDGIVEDLTIGLSSSFTLGNQTKNNINRNYFGWLISMANYPKWGYFNMNFEYGTFMKNGALEQSAITVDLNYFSKAVILGSKWKMRQFLYSQFIFGFNRKNTPFDQLNLNRNTTIYGYNRNELSPKRNLHIYGFESNLNGTKKAFVNLTTQFYSPWSFIGFRLNPYFGITSGILGNSSRGLRKSKVYSSFNLGFVIRNDYLIFNSFRLTFTYYPEIPDVGDDIFRVNSFQYNETVTPLNRINKPTVVRYE